MSQPVRWAVIVGNAKTNRNETIDALVRQMRAAGLTVGGIIQRPTEGGQLVENLITGETLPLGQKDAKEAELCSWSFDDDAFTQAGAWISSHNTDVLLIPVGRLERVNQGHWPAVQAAFKGPSVVILCISPTLLPRYMLELPDPIAGLESPAPPEEFTAFVRDLLAQIHAHRSSAPPGIVEPLVH